MSGFELSEKLNDGLIIALVGYIIVFLALVVLFVVFNNLSKLISYRAKQRLKREGKLHHLKSDDDLNIPGEVTAAISMALYLAGQLHDEESDVLTIKKVSRTYSPWSSKIYGLRNYTR